MTANAFGSGRCRLGQNASAPLSSRRILPPPPFHALAGFALAAAFVLLSSDAGFAQTIDQNLWVTNGMVYSVVRDGGTIYIAGNFTQVGPATGGGVPLDAAGGGLPPSFPKVTGQVYGVVSDGAGGWYIGGSFTAVGGLPRSNLAHIASDLTVSVWDPNASPAVRTLAVIGSTVYVGGEFTSIGGQARNLIAALDATTGAATAWNPNADGIAVNALVVSGSTIYVGGDFTSIGGQARSCIAALNATTGAATAWNPNADATVFALTMSGSTVHVGGAFNNIGGQARNFIAALNAATGAATAWNPNADQFVYAVAVRGSTVYAGGDFGFIGGQVRNHIAALDAATGLATAWDASSDGNVYALTVSGSTVYAGGNSTSAGVGVRSYIAALDAKTGATHWSADANSYVLALAVSGSTVYAGGAFTGIGGEARNYIAALDAATGVATTWNPNPLFGSVSALAVSGSTVYVAGGFQFIGGQARSCIAALNATTGAATTWNPSANAGVSALAVSGSTVYAGGYFSSIGGQSRNHIAALDAATGAATAWNPGAYPIVSALAVSGSTVYTAEGFETGPGQLGYLAAIDAIAGTTTWNANANGLVLALAVSGSTVYAGGNFTSIGGQARNAIASFDAKTGAATAWDPNGQGGYDPRVVALAVSGSAVYAGGEFTSIGGAARNHVAALDATTGAASAWNPDANGHVFALATSGSTVYVGGDFTVIGGLPQSGIAAMGDVTTPTLLSLVSARATPDRVELTWFSPAGDVAGATVSRRTVQGDWKPLGEIWADGTGRLTYNDAQVVAGTRYGYRLVVMEAGREVFLGETWVDVPATLELALAFRSNPAREDLGVTFSLPDASPARLELFDVGGRRIASRDVGTLGAGSHIVTLGDGRRFAPGVYLLRLSSGTRSLTARGAVVR